MSTIKISTLTSSGAILGNVLVPVVGNVAGTSTTLKSTVDQLKTFITASTEANILAANAATIFANTIIKGYVDGQITAANAGVTAANVGIIGYVDLANTIQTSQVSAANIGMKGYVDSVASQSIYGNINVKAYTESMGYQNFGNVNVAAYVTTANSAIIGYINLANSIQSQQLVDANISLIGIIGLGNTTTRAYIDGQITAANAGVTAANVGMKGYVDSLVGGGSSYGNGNVTSYLVSTRVSVANIKLEPSGNITFADGTVQTTAATGGNGTSNVNSVNGGYTDNSIIRYDGTSGNNIQNSLVTISDAGAITAASNTSSMIPFYYANVASFPDANNSHGALAHGHATGKMYYAHGGVWIEMANLSEVTAGGSSYGNANVASYLPTYIGVITASNVTVNGNVTAQYLFGNGSQLTGIVGGGSNYGNTNVTAYTESMGFTNYSNVNVSALITTNGLTNYSNVNAKAYAETMGYQNYGNVNVAAYVTTANSAVIGYVDNAVSTANVGVIGYIDRGNTIVTAGITTANVGLKGYVDAGIIWSISASGTADYVFSGPGIVAGNTNDPVLYLYKGFSYTFINTTGGSHPFAIRVSNGGADYTSGVSGSQTGTQLFIVPMDAPSTLYYQCTIHSGMGNTINIV